MKTLRSILSKKIFFITEQIQQNYPRLYEYLGETPVSLKIYDKPEIEDTDLIRYLEELIFQMNCYKNHSRL